MDMTQKPSNGHHVTKKGSGVGAGTLRREEHAQCFLRRSWRRIL